MQSSVVIYISGRCTGLKKDHYTQNFKKAEEFLQDRFPYAQIINPIAVMESVAFLPYAELMAISFRLLHNATSIYMLEDWSYSKGAKAELALAESLGVDVMYQNLEKEK